MTSRGFFEDNLNPARFFDANVLDPYRNEPQDLSMSSCQAGNRSFGNSQELVPALSQRDSEREVEVGNDCNQWLTKELICTESLLSEAQFHAHSAKDRSSNMGKSRTTVKRMNKVKSPVSVPGQSPRWIDKEKKSPRLPLTEKRKQTRNKKQEESGVSVNEVVVVDDMSILPVNEINGDLEFEDLEPEDLELVRHLPPPGNVQIGSHCRETVVKLKEFERKLQDIVFSSSRKETENMLDHDSDATLSIASDDVEDEAPRHPTVNPTSDLAMLRTYNYIFDPPVPAVITIPTSIVSLRSKHDWETESKAVQYLLSRNNKDRTQHIKQAANSSKRKRDTSRILRETSADKDVLRLITAIEIKSNQVINLKSPIFSLQYPPDAPSKQKPKVPDVQPKQAADATVVAPSNDHIRIKTLLNRLELDPFSQDFFNDALQHSYPIDEEAVEKAVVKKIKLEKQMRRKESYDDRETKLDFDSSLGDVQRCIKQLKLRKERAIAVTQEKFLLDEDEIEKRFNTSTEKAKSHVINMFEENRRQYELQRTLDFATCKCDMLSINTRNMRRREIVQPRTGEDAASCAAIQVNPSSSPNPHSSSSVLPMPASANSLRRRRNNFASALKETLEDREIYDDLNNVNRVIKEDAVKSRQAQRAIQVTADAHQLTIDGKVFRRNQPISVNHYEMGKYSGTLFSVSRTEVIIKRSSDGSRNRFPLGLLIDKRIILRKRAAGMKKTSSNGTK